VPTKTKSGALIRIMTAEDRNLAGILECWPPEWNGPFANEVLDIAVAIRAGKILIAGLSQGPSDTPDRAVVLGWLVWDDRFSPGSLYIRKAAVHHKHREKGILGLLLTNLVAFATKAGFRQIITDTTPDSLAKPEYGRKLGFEPIGDVTSLAGEGIVTTFWRLKPASTSG
jgi:hypothetical protein